MRKLKLQMQLSVDGFVAGQNGEMDWMVWDWDEDLQIYVNNLTDSVDTILFGRKMTDGFVSYWSSVVKNPDDPGFAFGKKMMDKPKIVFTKTLKKSTWDNTVIITGDLIAEVKKLKSKNGRDLIVYGGAGFVSALISHNLIDAYHLFINPAAIGKGLGIFNARHTDLQLKLVTCKAFACGIVVHQYEPRAQ